MVFALFLGTTMAISAMVIIARVLHDLDLVKSDLGLVTLCGYAVNDILAWVDLQPDRRPPQSAGALDDGLRRSALVVFTLVFTGPSP